MTISEQRIIDFRLRPPEKEFINAFPIETVAKNVKAMGLEVASSYANKSKSLLLGEMDEVGLKIGLMQGIHWGDIHITDQEIENIQQRYNGKMASFAYADLTKPIDEVVQDIETSINDRGFRGVAVETFHVGMNVDDERLFPVYEKCLELDVFVNLMSGPIGSMPDLSFTDPVRYEQVALKYPELKIVILHACYPYVTQACTLVSRSVRKGLPNIYLIPDMFLFEPGGRVYIEAIDAFPGNFLFASTYPYGPLVEAVNKTKVLLSDQKVREKVLYENAAKLLKL